MVAHASKSILPVRRLHVPTFDVYVARRHPVNYVSYRSNFHLPRNFDVRSVGVHNHHDVAASVQHLLVCHAVQPPFQRASVRWSCDCGIFAVHENLHEEADEERWTIRYTNSIDMMVHYVATGDGKPSFFKKAVSTVN